MKRKALSLLLALTLVVSLVPTVFAAEPVTLAVSAAETLHLSFWRGLVYINGTDVDFWDSEGKSREPFAYNGTVYIPLRSAGEWLGAGVEWDQESMTVRLISGAANPVYLQTHQMEARTEEEREQFIYDRDNGVDVQLRRDITVTLDGEVQHFVNVLGEPVYPLLFRECVYLPVRSVGELCSMEVSWTYSFYDTPFRKDSHERIYLYTPMTQEQIAAGRAYYETVSQLLKEFHEKANGLAEKDDLGREGLKAAARELMDLGRQIIELPAPQENVFQIGIYAFQANMESLLKERIEPYTDPEQFFRPEYAALDWTEHRDDMIRMEPAWENADIGLDWYRTILEAVEGNGPNA